MGRSHTCEAMSTRTSVIHKPLPHASEYLRILTLHSGDVSKPIRCTLQIVSFRDKPSYDALSYTWGDASVTRPIEVDGIAIQVTTNLEGALRHLRHLDSDLVLWVDAVCINQSDMTEKSLQVAVMGQIYRECDQVRIWLGCDTLQCRLTQSSSQMSNVADNGSEAVDPFEIVYHLANDRHMHEWPCFDSQIEQGRDEIVYKADERFDHFCKGFQAVNRSPWWTRVWTIQEAVLPRSGLVLYDTWTTSLQTVIDCGQRYYGHEFAGCCRDAESKLPSGIRTALREFCGAVTTLDQSRESSDYTGSKLSGLEALDLGYGYRRCEDPRDKVYGLLGIIADTFFTPDYTLCKEEVFFRATYRMLCRGNGNLSVLTGPQYGPAPGKWASWVRNFDAPSSRLDAEVACLRYPRYNDKEFDASNGHKSNCILLIVKPHARGDRESQVGLEIVGRRVGVITFVSENVQAHIVDDGPGERGRVLNQWILEALNWDLNDISAYLGDPSKLPAEIKKFWGMISGRSGKNVKKVLAWLMDESNKLDREIASVITNATYGRSYFKTASQIHGLCYPGTRVGDEVWVLDGGRVPFILRSAPLGQEERQALQAVDTQAFGNNAEDVSMGNHHFCRAPEGYYQFIGDCRLSKHMHGSATYGDFREQNIVLV
jgi:hypothetical protein